MQANGLAMRSAGFIALYSQITMLFNITHYFHFYHFLPYCLLPLLGVRYLYLLINFSAFFLVASRLWFKFFSTKPLILSCFFVR